MDRRTILAFVLIFLVYVGWMKLYGKMYSSPARPTAADSVGVAAELADVAGPESLPLDPGRKPVVAEHGSTAEDGTARGSGQELEPNTIEQRLAFVIPVLQPPVVRVRTTLYEVEISLVGGRITSWFGLEFPGIEEGLVQLIPPASERPLRGSDALLFQKRELDLGHTPYAVVGAAERELRPGDEAQRVVLRAETAGGLIVTKSFTFHAERYDFDMNLDVSVPRYLLQDLGDPDLARFGWNEGIASTEANKKMETSSFRSFALVGEDISFKKRSNIKKPEKVEGSYGGSVRFAGLQNRYFIVAGIAPQDPTVTVVGRIQLGADPELNLQTWVLELPYHQEHVTDGLSLSSEMTMYIGPSDVDLLKHYGWGMERVVDLGFRIIRPLSELILTFMFWLHGWIPNYGYIIILLSVGTRLIFYPLNRKQTESMKKMQELQPKIKALQEKYKDSREKLSQETMKLYRQEKVNPMAGCLPLLVQMPVFFALFQALRSTIALRQAPFIFWIKDLSQPDALFQLPFTLPLMGSSFNVLPILMSLSMYFQTKLSPSAGTGQMAMMNTMMPIMMLVFFYSMPSGLVLYWFVSTLFAIYQTWRVHSKAVTTEGAKTA